MKNIAIPLTVFFLAVLAGIAVMIIPGPVKAPSTSTTATTTPQTSTTTTSQWPVTYKDVLVVNEPTITGTSITVTGKARGWYFEASFPVQIKDASGKVIAQGPAQAQGDWMTSEFVPFSITLTFAAQPAGSKGTILLHNDNPSGLPQNDDQKEIPITFK